MADDFDSRTEAATPRRREEAREQGQVAFSTELVTGVLLLAAAGALSFGASRLGGGLLTETQLGLLGARMPELTVPQAQALLGNLLTQGAASVGPVLGVLFASSLGACLLQVGFRPNTVLLGFNWERLSPWNGGRIFSWSNTMKGAVAAVRLLVVAALAWWALGRLDRSLDVAGVLHLPSLLGQSWALVLRLVVAIAAGLLLLGVADYGLQLWRLERSLRMSKQEIKDEAKRDEGDPLVKARVRRLQREAAKKKMFHEVKTATIIVTNPTHLAVALRYERGTMAAPRVVAKGAGHVAKRIAELARRHGVPVLERKSLAQALFRTVKLNQEIPAGLFHAVAELLAHLYRLRHGGTANPKSAA